MAQEVLDAEEGLVVVDLGDPFRFDRYQEFLLPTQADVARAVMVAEAGRFVRDLSLQRPEGTVILIISPHPGESRASAGMWLTPVLCLGLGEGLLTSATTLARYNHQHGRGSHYSRASADCPQPAIHWTGCLDRTE